MTERNKGLIYISITSIILLIFSSFILHRNKQHKSSNVNIQFSKIMTVSDVQLEEYDKTGLLKHVVKSSKLKHLNDTENQLDNPFILYYKDNQPWEISAKKAILTNNGKMIELIGNVDIQQFQNHKLISQLKTEQLYYFPDSKQIQTEQPVIYTTQNLSLKSTGFKADLNKEIVQLDNKSQGVIHAKPS